MLTVDVKQQHNNNNNVLGILFCVILQLFSRAINAHVFDLKKTVIHLKGQRRLQETNTVTKQQLAD